MERITKIFNDSYIVENSKIESIDGVFIGEAVDRLATFENILDKIEKRQQEIAIELEKIHKEDKMKSYKFRELMAEKMVNDRIISTFKIYGLKV